MRDKLANFEKILKNHNLDGFITTNQTNIFYLTGFRGISPKERESILVLTSTKATLITARLYQTEAKRLADKDLKVKIVNERNQIFDSAKKLLKDAKRIGFEQDDLTFGEYQEFRKALQSSSRRRGSDSRFRGNDNRIQLTPSKNLIEDLRAIKTEDEIKKIEKAQIISQKAFREIIKTIKVGQAEEEIAERLAKIIKSLGGQGLAFESIIASGPNSGIPHHVTGRRKVKRGDVLLFDFGAKYQNYCADFARTIFMGRTTDRWRNIFSHVLAAQQKVIGKIANGLKSKEAFKTAHNHFQKHKLHKHFIHGLGHGVGLEVHEAPYLRNHPPETRFASEARRASDQLLENMVFSIEPALYFPWGGIRIEDLVVIKDSHAKVLGEKPK